MRNLTPMYLLWCVGYCRVNKIGKLEGGCALVGGWVCFKTLQYKKKKSHPSKFYSAVRFAGSLVGVIFYLCSAVVGGAFYFLFRVKMRCNYNLHPIPNCCSAGKQGPKRRPAHPPSYHHYVGYGDVSGFAFTGVTHP